MTRTGEILYLVFRVVCYCALALVVAGFGSFMVLGALDVCPRLDTGSIQCNMPFQEEVAHFGMGVMLISVFTGAPLLLAMAGLFFAVRGLYRRFGPEPAPGAPESRTGRTLRIVFKYVLIAFGVLILIGFIGGIVGGVMG